DQALQVIEGLLSKLPAGDRVKLIAVDSDVKALSNGFFAPGAPETRTALAQLRRRVPLGAPSLAPALTASLESFSGARARSVLYVGEGMSRGRLIHVAELVDLVSALRRERVAVHSYAIGPRTDLQILGFLATHTGGVTLIDELVDDRTVTAEAIGAK